MNKESYLEQILEECRLLRQECATLREENRLLREEVKDLKRRLGQNSQNSSRPPSSDGLKRPLRTMSLRTSNKERGGQSGHEGKTLQQVDNPDKVILHKVKQCPSCHEDLSHVELQKVIRRQVFDIPLPRLEVTEHHLEVKQCSCCGIQVQGIAPDEVQGPVQYGLKVKSLAAYLQNQHYLPFDRLSQLFKDTYNLTISEGSLEQIGYTLADKLEGFDKELKTCVEQAPVKHADETGYRLASKTHWLHVLSTEDYTSYRLHAKRAAELSNCQGIVVHDHWKSYYRFTHLSHALCNAHHLRELKALSDVEGEEWAKTMSTLLKKALELKKKYEGEIPVVVQQKIFSLYDLIINKGLTYHHRLTPLTKGKRGGRKKRIGHNLLLRFKEYGKDVLRFVTHSEVPFTNNLAERDLRMMKVKQKISGCFRTAKGALTFCRIRSFLSTARKQGWNLMHSISEAFQGNIRFLSSA
jgi:transposase